MHDLTDTHSVSGIPPFNAQLKRASDLLLEQQIKALEAELRATRKEMLQILRLGFVNDRQWIFIDQTYGGLWYRLSPQNQPIQIEAEKLIGYIRQIEIKAAGEGRRKTHKLLIHVDGDRRYILRTGHKTHFAKGMLMALATMSPAQLRRPVAIQPQRANDTVFCNLHQDDQLIRAKYSDQTDWRAIAERAYCNLLQAKGLPGHR